MHTQRSAQSPITFTPCHCGHIARSDGFTTGYGTDKDGHRHCFACCGLRDRAQLTETGRGVLYLSRDRETGRYSLSNWPGTLTIPCGYIATGRHNWARVRYDVRFRFAGSDWTGTQYGDNTQVCHVRRLKGARS